MATSEPPIITRSRMLRGRMADTMPTGMPMSIQTMKPPTVTEIVAGSREKISDLTDSLL